VPFGHHLGVVAPMEQHDGIATPFEEDATRGDFEPGGLLPCPRPVVHREASCPSWREVS
jgi:hypothetical protein